MTERGVWQEFEISSALRRRSDLSPSILGFRVERFKLPPYMFEYSIKTGQQGVRPCPDSNNDRLDSLKSSVVLRLVTQSVIVQDYLCGLYTCPKQ